MVNEMHTPRIFTSPGMSGYAYSGLSSREYKDSLCRAITTGLMSYEEFLKVLRECVAELRNTFSEIRGVDAVFAKHADRVELLASYLDEEGTASADPAVRERVLHTIIHSAYDMLHDCATAQCNKEVPRFMDPDFTRREVHLQIAKVCAILVNAITMANCYVRTIAEVSDSAIGEADEHSAFHANMALSAYVNAKFSALSRCLNSSPGSEETKRRKAILRVVRHNIELCNKVAELVDPNMLRCFRDRTGGCLDSLLAAVRSSSAECKEMVCNNESVQRRLAIARKARFGFECYCKVHKGLGVAHDLRQWERGRYTRALVHVTGSLFSMYRGYAAAGNAEHIVASKIERCIKILFTLYRYNARRSGDLQCKAREVYADMLCVYAEINEHIRPDLLLNPQAEIRWREAALQYCTEMMDIWKALHGRHLDVFEQPEGSPSQPSTSGLGSAGAGIGGSQASYTLPHDPGGEYARFGCSAFNISRGQFCAARGAGGSFS
ncbi:putative hGE-14 protein [Anaplasma phagocytophilum str. ApMUC09]|uniref:Putative hGE-14 protein n=1 Tax=Anaplasma phagocytophilum str. ApMUC09 TaxID=1359152 RepID=A0A0F3NAC1_ANAPH|nr:putative hGE-14 protein [Anaplasma phagocytophilum str. ApMUC09]